MKAAELPRCPGCEGELTDEEIGAAVDRALARLRVGTSLSAEQWDAHAARAAKIMLARARTRLVEGGLA